MPLACEDSNLAIKQYHLVGEVSALITLLYKLGRFHRRVQKGKNMIEEFPALISTLGFPIAVVCFLLWERHQTMKHFENVIKVDLIGAISTLKVELVKLNERCNGGKKAN